MESKKNLVTWLNEAYEIEITIIESLEIYIEELRDKPPLNDLLVQFKNQKELHAEQIKREIEKRILRFN